MTTPEDKIIEAVALGLVTQERYEHGLNPVPMDAVDGADIYRRRAKAAIQAYEQAKGE